MITGLSWRNIWRNRSRSLVVMGAVALGIWAGIVANAFFFGMTEQRTAEATRLNFSHLQVHHPSFVLDPLPQYQVENSGTVTEQLRKMKGVVAVSGRMMFETLISNATGGKGVNVVGIIPEDEIAVSGLDEKIIEGKFLDPQAKNPIVVGKKTADALKLKLKSTLIVQFQNAAGEFIPMQFKVNGIFKTNNSAFDESTVYVRSSDILRNADLSNMGIHEIAIYTSDYKNVGPLAEKLTAQFPTLKIQTWKEISPETAYANDYMTLFLLIFMGIIMVALAFAILNTMLMAVLERTRETGMLMSLGMNKRKVFLMIMLETVFLTVTALPLGLLAAWLTVSALARTGIDLSIVGEGMNAFGIDNVVYPYIPGVFYLYMAVMVFFTALLTAIPPALRAIRLSPAEATRKS